jgi:hypothetical protein
MKILLALLAFSSTVGAARLASSLAPPPHSLDLTFSHDISPNHHRRLQSACAELTSQVSSLYKFEGKSSTLSVCNPCSSSRATCYSVFGEVCVDADCGDGEEEFVCTVNASSVEVCEEPLIRSQWTISRGSAKEISRTVSNYYTTGTVNITNVTDWLLYDEFRQPNRCEVYVDGTLCNSCEICARIPGEDFWPRTFDCSNIATNATETCSTEEILLDDLTMLDPNVTRGPVNYTLPPMPTSSAIATASTFAFGTLFAVCVLPLS